MGIPDLPNGVNETNGMCPGQRNSYQVHKAPAYSINKGAMITVAASQVFNEGFPADFSLVTVLRSTQRFARVPVFSIYNSDSEEVFSFFVGSEIAIVYQDAEGSLIEDNLISFEADTNDMTWHRIAFSFKGDSVTLIMDCSKQITKKLQRSTTPRISNDGLIFMGVQLDEEDEYFVGEIQTLFVADRPDIAYDICTKYAPNCNGGSYRVINEQSVYSSSATETPRSSSSSQSNSRSSSSSSSSSIGRQNSSSGNSRSNLRNLENGRDQYEDTDEGFNSEDEYYDSFTTVNSVQRRNNSSQFVTSSTYAPPIETVDYVTEPGIDYEPSQTDSYNSVEEESFSTTTFSTIVNGVKIKSLPGPRGTKGQKGDKGDPGDKGDMGRDGIGGNPGPAGPPGHVFMVPLGGNGGEKGPDTQADAFRQMLAQHMTAMKGPEGPMGLTGLPGHAGKPGDQGQKGEHGDQGPPGVQGSRGPMGLTGREGKRGRSGRDGERGSTGSTGVKGDTGR